MKIELRTAENSTQLLHNVEQILNSLQVSWAGIGALGVAFHGWIRASLDADALITLRGSKIEIEHLVENLRAYALEVELRIGDEEDPLGFVIRIQDVKQNQVDLIGGIRKLDKDFF